MKLVSHKIIRSFINSRQSPAIMISLKLETEQSKYILKLLHNISLTIPSKFNFGSNFKKSIHTKVIAEFAQVIYNILHEKNLPIREIPTILPKEFNKFEKSFNLIVYSHVPKAFFILSELILKIIQDKNSEPLKTFEKLYTDQFVKKLENIDGFSRLNKNFINSAYTRDIPFLIFSREIIQFGWGKKGFHLGGTFTENTPRNSVVTVRNKYITSLILKKAGFPVIEEALVKDKQDCVKFTKKFGYPVVLKPADKDSGQGIQADILNKKELTEAFDRCQKISKNVLIQRFIKGAHYRFTTVNGKVVWIYQIDSAFVLGDGKSSLSILIKKENATPKRTYPYKRILINDTTESILKRQNLKLESIPKKGQKIQLGIVQNVYEGAIPVVIPPEKVHPDNILLIERAANLFRLDITGIDFFISDISKKWYEVESQILEINSCPDLNPCGPHLYDVILTQSIPGNGRIPSALIFKEKNQDINLYSFISFLHN